MDEFTFQSFQGNMMSQVREGERKEHLGRKNVVHWRKGCLSLPPEMCVAICRLTDPTTSQESSTHDSSTHSFRIFLAAFPGRPSINGS